MNLEGTSAVVTGGSRGLGRGIVEALAKKRARVVAVGREKAPLESLAREVEGAKSVSLLP